MHNLIVLFIVINLLVLICFIGSKIFKKLRGWFIAPMYLFLGIDFFTLILLILVSLWCLVDKFIP